MQILFNLSYLLLIVLIAFIPFGTMIYIIIRNSRNNNGNRKNGNNLIKYIVTLVLGLQAFVGFFLNSWLLIQLFKIKNKTWVYLITIIQILIILPFGFVIGYNLLQNNLDTSNEDNIYMIAYFLIYVIAVPASLIASAIWINRSNKQEAIK